MAEPKKKVKQKGGTLSSIGRLLGSIFGTGGRGLGSFGASEKIKAAGKQAANKDVRAAFKDK